MRSRPRISVVTPSFRQSKWLKLCVASVADQGVELEHLVQDACSDDETKDWLLQDRRVHVLVEKDAGMYDAINRGLRRAQGDVCAYLNCDEQLLPGSLERVDQFFQAEPAVDILFGDALVVDGTGQYICHRQTLVPSLRHTVACHLGVLSCATFFRRRLIEQGLLFDPAFRATGDADWVIRCLQARVPMAHVSEWLSVFTDTGANLGFTTTTAQEMIRIQKRFPAWWTRTRLVWATAHRFRRWHAGYYRPEPLRYRIYTLAEPNCRTEFQVTAPAFLWGRRFRVAG